MTCFSNELGNPSTKSILICCRYKVAKYGQVDNGCNNTRVAKVSHLDCSDNQH